MPLTTQTKILRVLQEGEISRVGNNQSIKTDVRIIAATNKDLWQAVQRKEFREDLFYRLNVVRVNLPPLRERTTDMPLLVAYFINKFRLKQPTGPSQIADEALAAIQRYPWPGNVRELENCIQRAMVLASGNTITLANLPEEIARGHRPRRIGDAAIPAPAAAAARGIVRRRRLRRTSREKPHSPTRWKRFSISPAATSNSNSCPPPNANSSCAPWPKPPATRSRPPSFSASPAPRCASGSTNSASKSGWRSIDSSPSL